MSESLDQTLVRLRGLVARLDGSAAGIRADGVILGGVSPEMVSRQIEIANDRSDAEKAIAALTVGKIRTV